MEYTGLRNSLSNQYRFPISLLLKDLYGAVYIIKKTLPNSGRLLEFMFISRKIPEINDFKICDNDNILKIIDCASNTIFSNSIECRRCIITDCRKVAALFHLSDNELEFYYFMAAVCYVFESLYNDKTDLSIFTENQLSLLKDCALKLQTMLIDIID